MGKNRNRNRGGGRKTLPKQQIVKDEYNLEDNFKKVSQYVKKTSRPRRELTEQDNYYDGRYRMVNSSQSSMKGPTESDTWNKYTHLDDKITDYQNQNENAHNQIRKDLGDKIESDVKELRNDIKARLTIKWYSWTIAALVAIAALFYALSYSRVLSKQEEHSNKIESISIKQSKEENEIEDLQIRIDKVDEVVYKRMKP